MRAYHITDSELAGRLGPCLSASSHAAMLVSDGVGVRAISAEHPISADELRQARSVQNLKGFFLSATELVGQYGPRAATPVAVEAGLVLMGVRACELRARKYLDQVMLGKEFDDPVYRARREATAIVSCDCADCAESCFCTRVGGTPYPTEGYDVNLSPVDGGWIVEVATEKGQQLVEKAGAMTEAGSDPLQQRDRMRAKMTDRVSKQNARFAFSADDQRAPALPEGADEAWQEFAADCVECGACTNICPTCYCFYLYDQALSAEAFERIRIWDSCLLSTYHRMAGGVNMKLTPRPRLLARLANRVLHKFTYSRQQYGLLGCVGCGRCIDACLGAIDIRQVVQALGSGDGRGREPAAAREATK